MLAISMFSTLVSLLLASELAAANFHESTPLSRRTPKHRRKDKGCASDLSTRPSAPPIVAAIMAGSDSGPPVGGSPSVTYVDVTETVTTKVHPTPPASAVEAPPAPPGGDAAIVGAILEGGGNSGGAAPNGGVIVIDITSTILKTVHTNQAPSATRTQHKIPEVAAIAIKTDSLGQTSTIWDTGTNPGVQQTSMPNAPAETFDQSPTWEGQYRWVQKHNEWRRKYGAADIQFKAELVLLAQEKAGLCNKNHTKAAENLQWGSGFGTPEAAVDGWASEDKLYNWNNPGYSEATGHFTQVVWRETRYVGCYIAKCDPRLIVDDRFDEAFQAACEYEPAAGLLLSDCSQFNAELCPL